MRSVTLISSKASLLLIRHDESYILLIRAGGIYVTLEGTPPQPVVKASPTRLRPSLNWPVQARILAYTAFFCEQNAPIPMSRIFFQHCEFPISYPSLVLPPSNLPVYV